MVFLKVFGEDQEIPKVHFAISIEIAVRKSRGSSKVVGEDEEVGEVDFAAGVDVA